MFNGHNSMMILGLLNTLANKGDLTEEERVNILNLGNFIERCNLIRDSKKLVAEIENLLRRG